MQAIGHLVRISVAPRIPPKYVVVWYIAIFPSTKEYGTRYFPPVQSSAFCHVSPQFAGVWYTAFPPTSKQCATPRFPPV